MVLVSGIRMMMSEALMLPLATPKEQHYRDTTRFMIGRQQLIDRTLAFTAAMFFCWPEYLSELFNGTCAII